MLESWKFSLYDLKGDDFMLAELRQKSQITIPEELIVKPGLVYPKKYLRELQNEINDAKEKIASGEQPVFDDVDALFAKLETD